MKKVWIVLFVSAMFCSCAAATPSATGTAAETTTAPVAGPAGTTAAPASGGTDCYNIGYRWGACAARNTADGSCDPEKEAIPQECVSQPITQQGIKDGLRDVQSGKVRQ